MTYPHMTEDFIGDELDMVKGMMFCNWSLMNEANKHGTGMKIVNETGYIARERKRLKSLKK